MRQDYMTSKEVCETLGRSEATLYRWLREGKMTVDKKVSGYFNLFSKAQVDRIKEERIGRITVASWRPGMECNLDGKPVAYVEQSGDVNWYIVTLKDGTGGKVYKNTGLVKV